VSFSYAATCMNEDSEGGGDFPEQLPTLIFSNYFWASSKSQRVWV